METVLTAFIVITILLFVSLTLFQGFLESQDALLAAQNSLTRAVVDYRIAELELQRDMGLLKVNEKGLWREFSFSPEVISNDE